MSKPNLGVCSPRGVLVKRTAGHKARLWGFSHGLAVELLRRGAVGEGAWSRRAAIETFPKQLD